MHFSTIALTLSCGLAANAASSVVTCRTTTASAASTPSASAIGYDAPGQYIASTVTGNNLTFGQHYAVLNLDLINGIVAGVAGTPEGNAWIQNTKTWINAVHQQSPPPLSIFSRIYFANTRKPEIKPGGAFSKGEYVCATSYTADNHPVSAALTTESNPLTQIYPAFTVDAAAGDVVVVKTGFSATRGNDMIDILQAQSIDTVILSGIRTSGVILATTYRLYDLGFKVYVIANNTIEPPSQGPAINQAILTGIIPKLYADVITIEQALSALGRSGPAIY